MTPRSPKQQPKTTTISRRLRNRADQNLSVQPPELPHVRGLRSNRAATLPSTRRISVNYQTEEAHTSDWDPNDILDPFTRSNTSHPSGLEQNPPADLLLSQPLDFPPYHSPQRSPSDLAPLLTQTESEHFSTIPTSGTDLLPSPLPSVSGSHPAPDYELRLSTEPDHPHDTSLNYQDMSTLGFMMPAQYGSMNHYGSPPPLEPSSYSSMNQHSYAESRSQQPAATSGSYAPSYTSSALQEPRRSGEHTLPPYQPQPRSPYQQPLGSMRASPSPMAYPASSSEPSPLLSSASHAYSYPAVHANAPGLTSNSSSYPPAPIYPPSSYEMGTYSTLPPTMYPPVSTAAAYPPYESGLAPPNAGSVAGLPSSPSNQGNGVMPRVLNSRPKPQCWEHGCNGRQFSTFSNLLRHQREKSGTAAKSYCPRCGAEFTRTTARNGHMAHEKCKPRRTSDSSR